MVKPLVVKAQEAEESLEKSNDSVSDETAANSKEDVGLETNSTDTNATETKDVSAPAVNDTQPEETVSVAADETAGESEETDTESDIVKPCPDSTMFLEETSEESPEGEAPAEAAEPEPPEEELVDPHEGIKEHCSEEKKCVNYREKLDECNARVNGKAHTTETCEEELIDFIHCVDHCVSKSLFSKLK